MTTLDSNNDLQFEAKGLDPLVDRLAMAIGDFVISRPQAPLTELKFRPCTKPMPPTRSASRANFQPASRRSSDGASGPASKLSRSKADDFEIKVLPGGR